MRFRKRQSHRQVSPFCLAIAASALIAAPSRAEATTPSFDCAKATRTLDRAICADPTLAGLDASLETTFRAALRRDPAGKAKLLDRQRAWLAGRADNCNLPATGAASSDNRKCVAELYKARIGALEAGSRPDAAFCQSIRGRIKGSYGYLAKDGWMSIANSLSGDPNSPVRFFFKGEPMTPKLSATLKSTDNYGNTTVYRIGPSKSLLAAKNVAGSMHCESISLYKLDGIEVKPIDLPVAQDDGEFCGASSIYVGEKIENTVPLFANEVYTIDKSSLDIWARTDEAWHSACQIEVAYDTELNVSARTCAPNEPCAMLEAKAIALARARDRDGSQEPPSHLGQATLSKTPGGNEAADLPTFDDKDTGPFMTFEAGAPLYEAAGPNGPIMMRISHGTLGWRTSDGYLVGIYERKGVRDAPIAGFMIHKQRVRLREVVAR